MTSVSRPRLIRWAALPSFVRRTTRRLPDRLRRAGPEVSTFAVVGAASTLAYVVLYAGLRGQLAAPAANAVALVVTAVANTAANRRFTFRIRGRDRLLRDHAAGLMALVVALGLTNASLDLLALVAPRAPRLVEIGVLLSSQVLATAVRFVLLRAWVARPGRRPVEAR